MYIYTTARPQGIYVSDGGRTAHQMALKLTVKGIFFSSHDFGKRDEGGSESTYDTTVKDWIMYRFVWA